MRVSLSPPRTVISGSWDRQPLVINPPEGCHYFLPSQRLPSQLQNVNLPCSWLVPTVGSIEIYGRYGTESGNSHVTGRRLPSWSRDYFHFLSRIGRISLLLANYLSIKLLHDYRTASNRISVLLIVYMPIACSTYLIRVSFKASKFSCIRNRRLNVTCHFSDSKYIYLKFVSSQYK